MKEAMKRLMVVVTIGCLAIPVMATDIIEVPLTDMNSIATFELNTSMGLRDWTVDGVNHISRQWFWYRIGNEAGIGESSIDTISAPEYYPSGNSLTVYYTSGSEEHFEIELSYVLTGALLGSHTSHLLETIKITNTSKDESLENFHFFQYCDFDLGGTFNDASVWITGGNTAWQVDDSGYYASEGVVTRSPSHYQVAYYDAVLTSLNDGSPTTLSDTAGPIGPGDLTWAFQWDFNLAPGGTYEISKLKSVTPEPATMSLLALGALGALLMRRRRK